MSIKFMIISRNLARLLKYRYTNNKINNTMQYIHTFSEINFNQSPYYKSRVYFCYLMADTINQVFRMPTNKTLFGVFGDDPTLRAFRIEKFIFTLDGIMKSACGEWGFAFVNIAGVGRKWITIGREDFIYTSVEEYRRYNGCRLLTEQVFDGRTATINQLAKGRLGFRLYDRDTRAESVSYGWVNNRLSYCSAEMCVSYDTFTDHLCIEVNKKDGYPYASAAQCVAENDVKVVTFDDAEQKEYEVEIEVIKTITTTIKCSSKESAVNAAKTAFEGKEIKVYVNHELEYSSY